MKKLFRIKKSAIFILFFVILLSLIGCSSLNVAADKNQTTAVSATVQSGGYDFSKLDQLMQRHAAESDLEGFTILLKKDGKVIFEKAYGNYSLDQMQPIASGTKWLSTSVIMTLVDDGLLSLDDPVSKYLPQFTGVTGKATIRMLLSHTSGLPDLRYNLTPVLLKKVMENSSSLAESVNIIAELANKSGEINPVKEPGTVFGYGEHSMQVAARIAEVVSGKPWKELFQEKIAGPLGMTNTNYNLSYVNWYISGLPSTYGKPTKTPLIASGAWSNMQDYDKFLTMILNKGKYNGKQVLSADSVSEMLKNQYDKTEIIYSPYGQYESINPGVSQTRYGLGNWHEVMDPKTGQALVASCQGAFGFSPWVDFRNNVTGVFLTKSTLKEVYPFYTEIRKVVDAIVSSQPASTTKN
ncbi:serine hydrolase domain-containing protein [Desulfosporosinus metallidurans]|uniref:Beta-lactamase-related domain-containing protein n=1 Tax=Desulfosporosinus metallidurans TaxID=1888891 RepID=A0A1Q8QHX9_9FIRM|nr:serine hydrolase domain-containing protein [Desulfosporosinus metallidurans]OLN26947.1 hypothetical protein DSOL_4766 [Desulfosporosinus metallidurans]